MDTNLIQELEMMAQQCSDMEVCFGTENTGNELGRLFQKAADALRGEYKRFAESEKERMRLVVETESRRLCSPLQVGIALALYHYNVSPVDRARKLYDHFQGDCAELHDLVDMLTNCPGAVCTELPVPTAAVYVDHALAKYAEEARERAQFA